MSITVIRDSVDYVECDIYARETLVGVEVEIAITYAGEATTWLASTYVSAPVQIPLDRAVGTFNAGETVWKATARTNAKRTFSAANYPQLAYKVRARLAGELILAGYVLNIDDK
jgi:hypothetical protein